MKTADAPETAERRTPRGGKPLGIGLLGCGTVGGGVLQLLTENERYLATRVGVPLTVERILVKDINKPRVAHCDRGKLTTSASDVLNDPAVELVIEVMGGEDLAGDYVEQALRAGKGVVTANKALLSAKGPALLDLAVEHRVDLAFEGAVGGGIPIIRTLREAFASDWVTDFVGIMNGTSNFVLTRMLEQGASSEDAIREAQELGFAEADPSLDVDGFDAAHKLVVSAMLAFGARVDPKEVPVEGIRMIEATDHHYADRFGYVIKHLAIGRDAGEAIELRVHPAFVPKTSVLANVSGVLNAILLHGKALGPCLVSGKGAGDLPTAVSVVADVLDVARSIVAGVAGLTTRGISIAPRPLIPLDDLNVRYYLRFQVADRPGVMGKIAGALGDAGVSIEQMVQGTPDGASISGPASARAPSASTDSLPPTVDVVMLTHLAREGSVRSALEKLAKEPFLKHKPRLIRIEDR